MRSRAATAAITIPAITAPFVTDDGGDAGPAAGARASFSTPCSTKRAVTPPRQTRPCRHPRANQAIAPAGSTGAAPAGRR